MADLGLHISCLYPAKAAHIPSRCRAMCVRSLSLSQHTHSLSLFFRGFLINQSYKVVFEPRVCSGVSAESLYDSVPPWLVVYWLLVDRACLSAWASQRQLCHVDQPPASQPAGALTACWSCHFLLELSLPAGAVTAWTSALMSLPLLWNSLSALFFHFFWSKPPTLTL